MASVSESEMAPSAASASEAFGIPEDSIDGVIEYLNEFGYETNGSQAIAMFRDLDVERRKLLARHMADIAKADLQLAEKKCGCCKRIARHRLHLRSRQGCFGAGRPAGLRFARPGFADLSLCHRRVNRFASRPSPLFLQPPRDRPVQVGRGGDQRLGCVRLRMVEHLGGLAASRRSCPHA